MQGFLEIKIIKKWIWLTENNNKNKDFLKATIARLMFEIDYYFDPAPPPAAFFSGDKENDNSIRRSVETNNKTKQQSIWQE